MLHLLQSDLGETYSNFTCYMEEPLSLGLLKPRAYQNIKIKRELQYFS